MVRFFYERIFGIMAKLKKWWAISQKFPNYTKLTIS